MKSLAASIVGLALAAAGCGTLASPVEYALYRKSRAAPDLGDRLAAEADYLDHYPKGAFVEEVKASFDRREPLFYRSKRGSSRGLDAYLRALPAGPHGVAAVLELAMMRSKLAKGDELTKRALATEVRLAHAASDRARVRDEFSSWIGRFLDPASFAVPIVGARAGLVVPWALSLPAPRCVPAAAPPPDRAEGSVARRCTKLEELGYLVVAGGGAEPREATVEIALDEDAWGRPLHFSIGGPDLFLRLEEAAVVRAFDPEDVEHRISAVARAVALVRSAFEAQVSSDAACARPITSPVVLDLACHGAHLVARSGTEPGEDDLVTITPE